MPYGIDLDKFWRICCRQNLSETKKSCLDRHAILAASRDATTMPDSIEARGKFALSSPSPAFEEVRRSPPLGAENLIRIKFFCGGFPL